MVVHARGLHLRGRGIKVALSLKAAWSKLASRGYMARLGTRKQAMPTPSYTATVLPLARRCKYWIHVIVSSENLLDQKYLACQFNFIDGLFPIDLHFWHFPFISAFSTNIHCGFPVSRPAPKVSCRPVVDKPSVQTHCRGAGYCQVPWEEKAK